MYTELLKETLEFMKYHELKEEEIEYIGLNDCSEHIPLDKWKERFNVIYYNGHGIEEINEKLVIIFKDKSIMVRDSCGKGAEWWKLINPNFTIPTKELETVLEPI